MALLFTVLLGTSASILGYFLYDFSKQEFVRETEAVIDSQIRYVTDSIKTGNEKDIKRYIETKSTSPNAFFRYERIDGTLVAGNMTTLPDDIGRVAEGILRFRYETGDETRTLAAKIHTFADGSRLMVARDVHAIMESNQRLQKLSLLIIFLMSIVVLVSFIISFFVVKRINTISSTARHIMETGDLSQRITIDTKWDDLSNLAQLLNHFLERIDAQMQATRQQANNIAHDLRTPLARMRGQIEEMKVAKPTKEDMEVLLKEADQILAIFNSLLRITNIEHAKRHQAFEPIDMKALLQDVKELYEPVAEEKNISLVLHHKQHCMLKGDKHLLFQLYANLVDNAIKFSPPDNEVNLIIREKEIEINDRGPGIKEEQKQQVFDRFYRADSSRNTPGHGLGLSLTKAIIELHKGQITLQDHNPGLVVITRF